MANQPTLLVTGASGQLGRRAVEILLEAKAGNVIAGTRDPSKIADLAAKGAEVRKVDFDDPALAESFKGVDRLLLISTDALDTPGKRLNQHKAAIAAAKKAGVKHIVYTSMPKPEPGSPIPFAPDHYGTEQALEASGIGWTVLRNGWYQENLLHSLPSALASGKWFSAAGDGKVAHVAREDAAYAAAAALAATPQGNARYDITGAELLTTKEIAKLASEATGKPVEVVNVTDEQLTQGMIAAGMPAFLAPVFASFDTNTRKGNIAIASDAVQKLTGRTPRPLKQFFAANKEALLHAH
ncbi:MAG: SDR family oxidoreductase [Xanthobacteraceae bacterium]|nr:SDR family oxidoreductase [Xanthobacteraceae bacterium]MCW5674171.1 SDR family oxidoreductase [Xanthobacteraceae bacterium]